MIAFFLSPLGRKIGAGLALVLALLYGYRIVTNRAYESGKIEGQKTATILMEKQAKAEWAQVQAKLDAQSQAFAAQVEELKTLRATFEAKRTNLTTTVVRTTSGYDTQKAEIIKQVADLNAQGVAAVAARVDTLIASYGDPQQALIALETVPVLRSENEDLKTLIDKFQESSDEDRKLSAAELAAAHDIADNITAQLNQTGRERDFYRDAYKVLSKKPHGFWHGVLKVVTLGIAR